MTIKIRTKTIGIQLTALFTALFTSLSLLLLSMPALSAESMVTISPETLKDKIKGAWAAQTIGVTYGFPVEFKFNSERVPDDYDLPWYDGYLQKTFEETQ